MGICWSGAVAEPPVKHIATITPTAPPARQYLPPPQYNPNYTYAVNPPQPPMYYSYPQQPYTHVYQQQPYPQQYVQAYAQQRQTTSPAAAFVGGLVLGSVVEDILDPTD